MVQGGGAASELRVDPAATLHGVLSPPGDKSISHRYVMLGGIARGETTITNLAPGADVAATVACMRALGVEMYPHDNGSVLIRGMGWKALRSPGGVLDAQNSGTTIRLLAGLLAGRRLDVTLSGDESLQRRPMRRVIEPLAAMGADVRSETGRAPLTIRGGGLHGIEWRPEVPSAQVKSAIMLAGLSATGDSRITESQPTRDHTELAFPAFGLTCSVESDAIGVRGGQEAVAPAAGRLAVPADPSSAAVWCSAAAALAGSDVVMENVCLNPRRLGFVAALRRMGADVRTDITRTAGGELVGRISVRHRDHAACTIDASEVPDLIDELPVLAARAALGGSLDVTGAAELRVKESDRITALVEGLRALGVDADERPDGFVVRGGRPRGGLAAAAGDHRLVMAFAIVGLGSRDGATITGAEAVAVSYPQFAHDLARLRR